MLIPYTWIFLSGIFQIYFWYNSPFSLDNLSYVISWHIWFLFLLYNIYICRPSSPHIASHVRPYYAHFQILVHIVSCTSNFHHLKYRKIESYILCKFNTYHLSYGLTKISALPFIFCLLSSLLVLVCLLLHLFICSVIGK